MFAGLPEENEYIKEDRRKGEQSFMKEKKNITKNRYKETDVDKLPEDFGTPLSEKERQEMYTAARARQGKAKQAVSQKTVSQTRAAAPQNGPVSPDSNMGEKKQRGKKVPKKKKKHFFRRLIVNLCILVLIFGTIAYGVVRYYVAKMDYQPYSTDYVRGSDVYEEKGVTNILLIGTDERHTGDTERSDTMILLSINPKSRKMIMTSILRDSYVEIPGYGKSRINGAYQFGGAALLIQTIEQNFKIGIDYYAKVDFYSFVDIVDAVGGVMIDVDEGERNYVNGYLNEINALLGAPEGDGYLTSTGVQLLNGKQALSYARIRYIGTDFQRTQRQREILQGVIANAKTSGPNAMLSLLDTVLPQIVTDIPEHNMTMLILKCVFYLGYDIEENRVPMDGTWWNEDVNGQEVLGIDFEANIQGMRQIIYGQE